MSSGSQERTLVATLGMAGLVSAADNWIVSPVLPAIAKSYGITVARAGSILTSYMVFYGLMQPLYGFFGDRWGKKRVLCWITFGLAAGTLGCAFAGSLLTLCVWRALTGFFAAGIIAVSLGLIGDRIQEHQRQSCVGRFMGIVFLGQGLSVGLGGAFARFLSWRVAFSSFAVVAAAAGLLLIHNLPNHGMSAEQESSNFSFFTSCAQAIGDPIGRVIFPLALLTGFLLLGIYSYLGSFLHDVAGLDYLQVGIVVMCYGFACLAAGAAAGRLGIRFGAKRLVLTGSSLALCSALLLAYIPRWPSGLVATIALGFGYIFLQSTLATLAFNIEPRGLPSALIGLGLFGGGALGTASASWILARWNYRSLWLVSAAEILAFLAVSARLRLPEFSHGIQLPDRLAEFSATQGSSRF